MPPKFEKFSSSGGANPIGYICHKKSWEFTEYL